MNPDESNLTGARPMQQIGVKADIYYKPNL
jgi:hypothetical protein